MKSPSRSTLPQACAAATMFLSGPVAAADIHVSVGGINSSAGRIMCRVFTERSGFPISGALRTVHAAIAEGASRCTFSGLPDGRYAIAVLHDTNSNDKLDKNFIGRPTEGLAFSNTVRPTFGVPSFSSAAFELASTGTRLSVSIVYP